MKKRRRRKIRIIYLSILLLFTFVMFSTSSYAWFTSNRIVTVNTINIHVGASGGVEISADGTNWKSIISPEDITGVHATTYPTSVNQLPYQLEPVSSGKEVDNNGLLKIYYGVTDNNASGEYSLTSTRSIETESNGTESNGKFIVFDLFFKTDNESELYLTNESNVVYTNPETSKGIANAARIAFVNEGTVPVGSPVGTIQGLRRGTSNTAYLWEPNYDTHTEAGVANARDVYRITTTTSNANRLEYDGMINEISGSDGVTIKTANRTNYPGFFKKVDVDYPTKNGFTDYVKAFTVGSGITKMRIYMWVEGQDVDCENAASYDDIDFNLQLTVNPSA